MPLYTVNTYFNQILRTILPGAFLVAAALSLPHAPAFAGTGHDIVPIEKEGSLDTPHLGDVETRKATPNEGRVRVNKEDISSTQLLRRKDPLVSITSPGAGKAARSYQKITGKVGGGIAKAFLRVNDDTQVVTVTGGAFEAYGMLKPGLNTITALAWDLDGNLGKDSIKVFLDPPASAANVKILKPAPGAEFDITWDRVITVEAACADKTVTEGVLSVNNLPMRVLFKAGVMRQETALLPGANEIRVEAALPGGRSSLSDTVRVDTFDARPKDLVAVLTWDNAYADMDLHVWDSFGHHTFNEAKDDSLSDAAIPRGSLDMDRKGDFGPEVFSMEAAEPEVYKLFVNDNPTLKASGGKAYLRVLLYGEEPSRRIMRGFGPMRLGKDSPAWEAAIVKMPEGVFFDDKEADLIKTFKMDSKAIRRLALTLSEENMAFRLLAVSAMGQIKSDEAVEPLVAVLASGPVEVRRAAAGALWNIRSQESAEPLIKALKDPDAEVRRAAAGALGAIGDERAISPLTGLVDEEGDVQARVEAIRALGRLGDPRGLASLLSQVKDEEVRVRVEAVRALSYIKDKKSVAALVAALSDKGVSVREAAAWGLGRLECADAVKPLIDALEFDPEERVRTGAAMSLGRLRDATALPGLEKAARQDASDRVRFRATKAVEGMTVSRNAGSAVRPAPFEPADKDEDVVVY